MKVELSDEEIVMLNKLIKMRIGELGPEIRHTRTPDFHDELKDEKARLRVLQERLAECHQHA